MRTQQEAEENERNSHFAAVAIGRSIHLHGGDELAVFVPAEDAAIVSASEDSIGGRARADAVERDAGGFVLALGRGVGALRAGVRFEIGVAHQATGIRSRQRGSDRSRTKRLH
jgi:hypothetical protein